MIKLTPDELWRDLILQPGAGEFNLAAAFARAQQLYGEAQAQALPNGVAMATFASPGRSLHFFLEAPTRRVLGGGLLFDTGRLTLGPCTALGPRAVAVGSGTATVPFTLAGWLVGGIAGATITATAGAAAAAARNLNTAINVLGPTVCPSPCQPFSIPIPGVPSVVINWQKLWGIPIGGTVTVTEVAAAIIFCQ
jgi:hypothetical protein